MSKIEQKWAKLGKSVQSCEKVPKKFKNVQSEQIYKVEQKCTEYASTHGIKNMCIFILRAKKSKSSFNANKILN